MRLDKCGSGYEIWTGIDATMRFDIQPNGNVIIDRRYTWMRDELINLAKVALILSRFLDLPSQYRKDEILSQLSDMNVEFCSDDYDYQFILMTRCSASMSFGYINDNDYGHTFLISESCYWDFDSMIDLSNAIMTVVGMLDGVECSARYEGVTDAPVAA